MNTFLEKRKQTLLILGLLIVITIVFWMIVDYISVQCMTGEFSCNLSSVSVIINTVAMYAAIALSWPFIVIAKTVITPTLGHGVVAFVFNIALFYVLARRIS